MELSGERHAWNGGNISNVYLSRLGPDLSRHRCLPPTPFPPVLNPLVLLFVLLFLLSPSSYPSALHAPSGTDSRTLLLYVLRVAGYAHRALLPPAMPVAAAEQLADSTSAHRPLTELRYGSVNRVRLDASCIQGGACTFTSGKWKDAETELRIATRDVFARACLNRVYSHICVQLSVYRRSPLPAFRHGSSVR